MAKIKEENPYFNPEEIENEINEKGFFDAYYQLNIPPYSKNGWFEIHKGSGGSYENPNINERSFDFIINLDLWHPESSIEVSVNKGNIRAVDNAYEAHPINDEQYVYWRNLHRAYLWEINEEILDNQKIYIDVISKHKGNICAYAVIEVIKSQEHEGYEPLILVSRVIPNLNGNPQTNINEHVINYMNQFKIL